MRHGYFGRKLNRDTKQRKALFRSLITALITYGKITTTLAKAKSIRGLAEKLVTLAKAGTESARVQAQSFVQKKEVLDTLVKEIAPRFSSRMGGYVRIIRLGKRPGDASEVVRLEWTEQAKPVEKVKKPKKEKEVKQKVQKEKKPKIKTTK